MKKNSITHIARYVCPLGASIIFIISFTFFLPVNPVYALLNPSAVYCTALGYNYVIEATPSGKQGICILAEGQSVGAWDFFLGKVAQDQSYCARMGYEMITMSHNKKCMKYLTDECAFCILPDGGKEEVSNLMGLSFDETFCGDDTCGIPENYSTCPGDCPSGSWDAYCDMVRDGIIDPDCDKFEDPDEMLLASTKITPQALNCESEGNWLKAHMIMPEGLITKDVDTETHAVMDNFGISSETITVFINEEGKVQADIAFSRETVCAFLNSIDENHIELNISARLTNGEFVFGNDVIKLVK